MQYSCGLNKVITRRGSYHRYIQSYIQRLKKVNKAVFYALSMSVLIACAPADDGNNANNNGLSLLDSKVPRVSIKAASWDSDKEKLKVDGEYTPANIDSPPDTDSIIITDVDMPNVTLGTVLVKLDGNSKVSWKIDIANIMVIPCKINASVGAVSDKRDVANASDICGNTGNNPTPPTNLRPIAVVMPSVNQSIALGDSINFMGDTSTDPDGNTPLMYAWTFDGAVPTTSSQANPVVQYNTAGNFSAMLTVTDSLGLSSNPVSIMVTVTNSAGGNLPPTAMITSMPAADNLGNINIAVGASINFTAISSIDPDGNAPLTYSWTFGSGAPANSTGVTPGAVVFNTTGNYQASLIVTDSLGLSSSVTSVNVIVANATANLPPTAVIGSTPAADNMGDIMINVGDSINFRGNGSSDSDGNTPLTYAWSFTSGLPSSSGNTNPGAILYNAAGNFQASLTVTDSLGLASTVVSVNVIVADPAGNTPPTAVISSTPAADNMGDVMINIGDSINFTATGSTDPDGNTPLTYAWTFPNATPVSSTNVTPGTVLYNTAGTFQANLTVTDSLGLASTISSVNVIVSDPTANTPPTAVISSTPAADNAGNIMINAGDSINFTGTSSTDPDGNTPLTYAWTFPNATPVSSTNVTPGNVVYSAAGNYQANLTVTDSLGLASTLASVTVNVGGAPPGGQAQTVSFVVLNDLHAHLTAHVDLKRVAGASVPTMRGGLARIATEVKRIRAENPATAFMNIGDTFHGGVEAFYTLGNDIVEVMNLMGVDVGVPGNWDFGYGPNVSRERFSNVPPRFAPPVSITQPSYPNLAANVTVDVSGFPPPPTPPPPEPFSQSTFNMNLGGVEVGFIGITSDIVPNMHPSLAFRMNFLQGELEYKNLINGLAADLRSGKGGTTPAQIVVVMSELGIHKDKQLADIINPGSVDVFFSAHTHELTEIPLTSTSGALVVEAGNDTYLGRMDIGVDQGGNVVSSTWKIIPIEMSIVEDTAIKNSIDGVRAKYLGNNVNETYPGPNSSQALTQSIDTVLATTNTLIERHNSLESSFNNLFTDMMKKVGNTDIALNRGFRFSSFNPGAGSQIVDDVGFTVATGEITIEDVYRFIPVPYDVGTGNVSVVRIKEIIEESLTATFSTNRFLQVGGWFDGYAGLSMNLNLAQPDGSRIVDLSLYNADGSLTPLTNASPDLSVTACKRPFDDPSALCAYTGFTNVLPLQDANQAPYTAIDFLIMGLKDPTIFDPNSGRTDVNDANFTELWPAGIFIQPINGVP